MLILLKLKKFFNLIFDYTFWSRIANIENIYRIYLAQKKNKSTFHFESFQSLVNTRVMAQKNYLKLKENQIFSNDGSDGIINYLLSKIKIKYFSALEIGSGGSGSSLIFLSHFYGWTCNMVDADCKQITEIKSVISSYSFNGKINIIKRFITLENINNLEKEVGPIDFLSIDVDGNDYYLWDKMNILRPSLVQIEYNSLLEKDNILTKYDKDYNKYKYHPKIQFVGSSLKKLNSLAQKKNYGLIYCNSSGNNAYFVDKDVLPNDLKIFTPDEVFVDNINLEAKIQFLKIDKNKILKKIKNKNE
jgi:hypothetical protein